MGVVAGAWFIGIGLVFGAEIQGGVAGVLVILALSGLSAIAFGGLAAGLALVSGRASVVQGTFPLAFVILFLSSAFFPQALMLEPAASAALWNPLSLIADGLREPVVAGLSVGALLDGLAGIGVIAACGFAASALALRARLRAA
jgi:ABC-2 type transport system permease protein